jgi:hypothetical protein
VSVLKYDFRDFEDWDKYEHLSIDVDDVEDENLLGEFERSGSWIEKGLREGKNGKKGGVLVHWYVNQASSYVLVRLKPIRWKRSCCWRGTVKLSGFSFQIIVFPQISCDHPFHAYRPAVFDIVFELLSIG